MKSVGVKNKITSSYENSDFYLHIIIYFKIHNTILQTIFYMFPNPNQTWYGSQLHGIVSYCVGMTNWCLRHWKWVNSFSSRYLQILYIKTIRSLLIFSLFLHKLWAVVLDNLIAYFTFKIFHCTARKTYITLLWEMVNFTLALNMIEISSQFRLTTNS